MKNCCANLLKYEPFFIKAKVISGRWAFHLQDTHGIPVELLPDMVECLLTKELV